MRNLRIFKLILVLLFFTTASNFTFAQDSNLGNHNVIVSIPEVALLDIETSGASTEITLGPTAPTEAGLPLDFSGITNNTLWLNYSSIKNTANSESSRTVSVSTSEDVPGITLDLAVGTATGGGGALGAVTSGSPVTISTSSLDIIDNVGSCYTGDGSGAGHQLTYTVDMDASNYADLDAESTTITVTYTLSDN